MSEKKAGKLFVAIVANFLKQRSSQDNHGVSRARIEEALNSADFDTIQSMVCDCTGGYSLSEEVVSVLNALFQKRVSTTEPEAYINYVLYGAERPTEFCSVIPKKAFGYGEMVCEILSSVHCDWLEANGSKFSDAANAGIRFFFMPVEMVGWEALKPRYEILVQILQDLLPPRYLLKNHAQIAENAYRRHSGDFFRKITFDCYGVLRDYLQGSIGNNCRPEIPQNVRWALQDGFSRTADDITVQIKNIWSE